MDGDSLGDTLTPYNSSDNILNGGDYHPLVRLAAPNITSFAPESPVNDTYCTWTKFNVTVDQTVNVIWYLDEVSQHTNESVTEANCMLHADNISEHSVSAVVENVNGTDTQTWVWNVTGETTLPVITIDAPTQSERVHVTGGEQFWVNFTYAELYPANYTVTVGNTTVVINSITKESVAGGMGMTANESFYLNPAVADGWYNVTVEMYDNSSNYNVTYQNHSVGKGYYDASISQPENQTTNPGVNASYTLVITNTGNFTGTFVLAVTNHNDADVAALNMTEIVNLAIGASQNVTLNVTDADAGRYNVTVNVTSNDSGSPVAETGYIMTTVHSPTLTLGSVKNLSSDWGVGVNVNHSVTITNANADNVNVTYDVLEVKGCTLGTVSKDATGWCNQSIDSGTVQNVTVRVDATSTTASAANDTGTFNLNITRRDIGIESQPVTSQSVDTDVSFWINASASDYYGDTLICKADLLRDGTIVGNQTISNGNVNFSSTESLTGVFDYSIRFYNTTHYNNETTGDSSITVSGPTLTLGSVGAVASDWGVGVNVNHSVTITNANADNVNVTYDVLEVKGCTLGTVSKDATGWCNQSIDSGTVQNVTVRVDATSTTASAANDTGTFNLNITRRDIGIESQPVTSQSVDTDVSFWINASASDYYGDTLICKADLLRDGTIVGNQTISNGNVNFSSTESLTGVFDYSIRFYNTTHYNNETTSNATMHIADDLPPASITNLSNLTTGQNSIHWIWADPADTDFEKVMIYLDGKFKTNVSKGAEHEIVTGLNPNTTYTISTRTVDTSGNFNITWVNDTVRTLLYSPSSSSSRKGTYPETVTVTKSSSHTPAIETPTPPGDRMMPAAANTTAPAAEVTTAETEDKSWFWLIVILLIALLLLIAYARRRRQQNE